MGMDIAGFSKVRPRLRKDTVDRVSHLTPPKYMRVKKIKSRQRRKYWLSHFRMDLQILHYSRVLKINKG